MTQTTTLEDKYFVIREALRQLVHAHKSFGVTDERWNEIIIDADRLLDATKN